MKSYRIIVSDRAKNDLKRYAVYVRDVKHNPDAAKSILDDFRKTGNRLSQVAGSIKIPDSEVLKDLGLRRLNFIKHDYFLLYRIENGTAFITNVFHSLEDFENKLR